MSRRLIRDAPATAFVLASTRMAIKHRVQTPIKTMQRKMRQCHKDVHAAKSVIATSQHTLYTRGLAEQKVRTRSPAELHAADDVNLTRMKCTLFVEAGPHSERATEDCTKRSYIQKQFGGLAIMNPMQK